MNAVSFMQVEKIQFFRFVEKKPDCKRTGTVLTRSEVLGPQIMHFIHALHILLYYTVGVIVRRKIGNYQL